MGMSAPRAGSHHNHAPSFRSMRRARSADTSWCDTRSGRAPREPNAVPRRCEGAAADLVQCRSGRASANVLALSVHLMNKSKWVKIRTFCVLWQLSWFVMPLIWNATLACAARSTKQAGRRSARCSVATRLYVPCIGGARLRTRAAAAASRAPRRARSTACRARYSATGLSVCRSVVSIAPRAPLPRPTRAPAGRTRITSRRTDARDTRRDARGAWGVPARCALAVRNPRFARRAVYASLFFSSRSVRAAPSLRCPPRRRHHHHERPCGARDVRRATRTARGESAGIPLSFVLVHRPRRCVSGLCSTGLLRHCVRLLASFRAPTRRLAKHAHAVCMRLAHLPPVSGLMACVPVGACVKLAGAKLV